eukprot:TRINITY_DN60351_c0_g1_i2.p3 TRINITY_DN60351_c0_g1~~TRINITY_DN60351_c0_g1_i2.p3  ORF type:complete len:112 (-),score=14.07 TRINITY_DN60351_c0_g1_i2:368-703(-)
MAFRSTIYIMDIAPRYAREFMEYSNTTGTLSGVVGVAVTGQLLDLGEGSSNLYGWYLAHLVSVDMCVSGVLMFIKFARGSVFFIEIQVRQPPIFDFTNQSEVIRNDSIWMD